MIKVRFQANRLFSKEMRHCCTSLLFQLDIFVTQKFINELAVYSYTFFVLIFFFNNSGKKNGEEEGGAKQPINKGSKISSSVQTRA